jgi:hypothetical protein
MAPPPCCLERLSGKRRELVSNSGKTEHTYDKRYKRTIQAVYKNKQDQSTKNFRSLEKSAQSVQGVLIQLSSVFIRRELSIFQITIKIKSKTTDLVIAILYQVSTPDILQKHSL